MNATIIQFAPYQLRSKLNRSQTTLQAAQVLTADLRDLCSETIDMADMLADGLTNFSASMDVCLGMLADGAERQRQIMTALESGDLAAMERCRDSMLAIAASS